MRELMKTRYRLIRRGNRGGAFYCVDPKTGRRTGLHVPDEDAAQQVIQAKNQAERQPMLNLRIAKAYLAGTDSGVATRNSHLAPRARSSGGFQTQRQPTTLAERRQRQSIQSPSAQSNH